MSAKQSKIEKYTKAINKSSDPKKDKKKKIIVDQEDEVEEEKVNTKGFEIKQSNSKVEYQKLELHEQILKRPDTYVKSIRTMMDPEPVYIMKENKIIKKQISYPLVLIRIYVEVLSNAIDNVWRSLSEKITPKFIKINIDKENNTISIWNDGKNITTTNHQQLNIPIPEMIFGHLLTIMTTKNVKLLVETDMVLNFVISLVITLKWMFIIKKKQYYTLKNGLIICLKDNLLNLTKSKLTFLNHQKKVKMVILVLLLNQTWNDLDSLKLMMIFLIF
jgi:hypothetical protein